MAKLIYSMITSLDGYAEAAEGDLGTGAEVAGGAHLHQRRLPPRRHVPLRPTDVRDDGLLGDRAHRARPPPHILQYARDWQAAEKIVYSTTLESVSSAKTRIERTFDPDAVRKLKAEADHDLTVDGPNLAAQAIAAGLVDEYHLFITTSVVGGGKRFFPDGVRLDLELVEERAFDSGLIYARYRTR